MGVVVVRLVSSRASRVRQCGRAARAEGDRSGGNGPMLQASELAVGAAGSVWGGYVKLAGAGGKFRADDALGQRRCEAPGGR